MRSFTTFTIIVFSMLIIFSEAYCWLGFARVSVPRFKDDEWQNSLTSAARFADFDNDSFPDLVLIKDFTKSRVYLNDTMGRFVLRTSLDENLLAADGTTYDVDNDSDMDIVHPGDGGTKCYIFYNDYSDSGEVIFSRSELTIGSAAEEVLVFHANGNTWPDIMFAISGNGESSNLKNQLFHQTSKDSFVDVSDSVLIPRDSVSTNAVAIGNVNNDSFPDIFFANRSDSWEVGGNPVADRLYLGTSGWVNRDSSVLLYPPDTARSMSVAFGDVDGDNMEDIIIGNQLTDDILYINYLDVDSLKKFVDMSDSLLPSAGSGDRTNEVNFADMENDGDLDIFIGQRDSITSTPHYLADNHIYLNNGNGCFVDASDKFNNTENDTVATNGNESTFADIDWDQDLDLFVSRWTGKGADDRNDDLFVNLYTQLFIYSRKPKPGQTINLVQSGENGFHFEIYACLDTVFEWDMPHGISRLDTSSISYIFVDSTTLDSTEIVTLQYTVPNLDSIIGEEIFFQTIIGEDSTSWIYGNLEKVEVVSP